MSGLFYNLGRRLGHVTVPAIRKTKWVWDGLTGSEEDAWRAERAMGASLAAELRATTEPADDPAISQLTAGLRHRLESRARAPRRDFHCAVIRGDFPNAMVLPGGYIFISESLVDLCNRQPDELAFVIAHEMAHVIRGHAWDRLINQTALRAASTVAARAGVMGGLLRQKGVQLLQSAFSQDCELEADELGLRLAVAAQFASAGAIALLQRIESLGADPAVLGEYFGSHPPASERISQLKRVIRRIEIDQRKAQSS